MAGFSVRTAGRTDVGAVRLKNEDAFHIGPQVVVVADGVGGAAAGEIASATVVRAFTGLPHVETPDEAIEALSAAIAAGGRAIGELIQDAPELEGMGTTVTVLAWTAERIIVAQVGDSRAYYLPRRAPRRLVQITRDDSLVQHLVDRGVITADEARSHPRRNVIVQAVNGMPVRPTFQEMAPVQGDRYLICSDGLSDYVPHETIERVLLDVQDADAAAAELVRITLDYGAPDNVTAVIADIAPSADETSAATERGGINAD